MKKLRVLSIDFDFFQDVDAHTMKFEYPDGVDLSPNLSTIVWGTRYSKRNPAADKVKAVTINLKLFTQMLSILDKQRRNTPTMIAQSHVSIYDFIHKYMKNDGVGTGYDGVSIVNVDMHHDLFNDSEKVDCGNWLLHIAKDIPNNTINWVTREVALECYGLTKDNINVEFNFDKLIDAEFDIIFLCRSDAWLPPHLDEWFIKMANHCCTHFTSVIGQTCVLQPRDVSDIIEAENLLYEDLMKQYGGLGYVNGNPIT